MPIITLGKKYRAEGLHALILQGEVYCLPDSVFIVPKSSLNYTLKDSPQPHSDFALGLVILKPDSIKPSV